MRRLIPPPRLRALLAGALALATLAWLIGFASFVEQAERRAKPPPYADGILVLTGGADRVERGLRLLAEGRGRLLLVSGVHGPTLAELTRRIGLPAHDLAARVTLGRSATSTVGNAEEAAGWVTAHHIRTLIVVTAGYHMPRALTELARALPGVALYPAPVQPPAMRDPRTAATLRLLAGEYTKWLASGLGLSLLMPGNAGV
ncbi:MAG TPA: YdcF family protein [Acetobacteraceae bacterium]|nr:YdcF family protein [Acetobacteraceae bacterium]